MKVLIIEDEPFAQNELKRILKAVDSSIEVLDCIDTIEDSILWFSGNTHPDLIFLDIQLSDGLSFEIFRHVKIEAPVIFTTAYDEYAIEAFKLNSIDYLLKPIKKEHLKAAINKLEKLQQVFSKDKSKLENIIQQLQPATIKDRFIIKIRDQIKYIESKDVAYFMADNTIVFLFDKQGNRYIIDYKLEYLNGILDKKYFFRISRGLIVNLTSVKKISKHLNGRLKLEIQPVINEEVYVSRSRVKDFLKWIDQ